MVWTYLHEICSNPSTSKRHVEFLLKYIDGHPDEAKEEDDSGLLPLHVVLGHNPPIHVVRALLRAYPEAAYCYETQLGYFPLHVACRRGCTVEVVELLLDANPDALKYKSQRNLVCCLEGYVRLCWGLGLNGMTALEMAEKLPPDNPNRDRLITLLSTYYV